MRCQERIQLKNGERGEIAWGGAIVPLEVSHVKAGCKTVGKTRVGEAKSGHLALKLLVGHTGGVAVDDAQVECGNFVCREIAVGGRCVEHEMLSCVLPL